MSDDDTRSAYINAAFQAGRERTKHDPLLRFSYADAAAMADAAVAALRQRPTVREKPTVRVWDGDAPKVCSCFGTIAAPTQRRPYYRCDICGHQPFEGTERQP